MAGKTKPMNQIKQLLQLYKQGESKKSMARILGISRNTVKAYLNKLSALDADIDILLTMEDSELEKQFHAGNPSYKKDRYFHLKNRLDYRSEEHTSELQSRGHLVCRLLLEKKIENRNT